jgi:GNAT superfamily N-acetyltransferase
LGVVPAAQGRGIGKMLMSSIFRIIPTITRISLCTRVTNKNAINAYFKWGFTIDPNPEQESWLIAEHWTSFKYDVEKTDVLQKTAENLKPY